VLIGERGVAKMVNYILAASSTARLCWEVFGFAPGELASRLRGHSPNAASARRAEDTSDAARETPISPKILVVFCSN